MTINNNSAIIQALNLFSSTNKIPQIPVSKKPIFNIIWHILQLWAIAAALAFTFAFLQSWILTIFNYQPNQHAIAQLVIESNPWITIFLAAIFAPVTEEISFRLGIRYNSYAFFISTVLLLITLLNIAAGYFPSIVLFLPFLQYFNPTTLIGIGLYLGLLAVGILLGYILDRSQFKGIENFYKKHARSIFYFSVLLFATIHFTNYQGGEKFWFLLPILVMPQFILGMLFAYIRVKFGFLWAVIAHAFHNFINLIPFIIITNGASEFMKQVLLNSGKNSTTIIPSASESVFVLLGVGLFLINFLLIIGLLIFTLVDTFFATKSSSEDRNHIYR
jgi:uncharacterized protein